MRQWEKEYSLNEENLIELMKGNISHIRMPSFATKEECANLSNKLEVSKDFDFYKQIDPPIGKLGITHYEGFLNGKEWYFKNVESASKLQEKLFSQTFNPIKRLLDLFANSTTFDVSIPEEPNFGKYFCGVIRNINKSIRAHADFAVYDSPNWAISNIESQIAMNLYCTMPEQGGECIVYNHLWNLKDDEKLDLEKYQFDLGFMPNAAAKVIKPIVGDLYLFNSRNFHEITIASSNRFSVSSFIGKTKNRNELMFWS